MIPTTPGTRVVCRITARTGTIVAPLTFRDMRRVKWDGYDQPELQQARLLTLAPKPITVEYRPPPPDYGKRRKRAR